MVGGRLSSSACAWPPALAGRLPWLAAPADLAPQSGSQPACLHAGRRRPVYSDTAAVTSKSAWEHFKTSCNSRIALDRPDLRAQNRMLILHPSST